MPKKLNPDISISNNRNLENNSDDCPLDIFSETPTGKIVTREFVENLAKENKQTKTKYGISRNNDVIYVPIVFHNNIPEDTDKYNPEYSVCIDEESCESEVNRYVTVINEQVETGNIVFFRPYGYFDETLQRWVRDDNAPDLIPLIHHNEGFSIDGRYDFYYFNNVLHSMNIYGGLNVCGGAGGVGTFPWYVNEYGERARGVCLNFAGYADSPTSTDLQPGGGKTSFLSVNHWCLWEGDPSEDPGCEQYEGYENREECVNNGCRYSWPREYSVLIHEIGHNLNIYHTHQSYEGSHVNHDNCETTGDSICDTPPANAGGHNKSYLSGGGKYDGFHYGPNGLEWVCVGVGHSRECVSSGVTGDTCDDSQIPIDGGGYYQLPPTGEPIENGIISLGDGNVSGGLGLGNFTDNNGDAYGTKDAEECIYPNECLYSDVSNPINLNNFMSYARGGCRNRGCSECGPRVSHPSSHYDGFTLDQFSRARACLSTWDVGCWDENAWNYDPNTLFEDNSECRYGTEDDVAIIEYLPTNTYSCFIDTATNQIVDIQINHDDIAPGYSYYLDFSERISKQTGSGWLKYYDDNANIIKYAFVMIPDNWEYIWSNVGAEPIDTIPSAYYDYGYTLPDPNLINTHGSQDTKVVKFNLIDFDNETKFGDANFNYKMDFRFMLNQSYAAGGNPATLHLLTQIVLSRHEDAYDGKVSLGAGFTYGVPRPTDVVTEYNSIAELIQNEGSIVAFDLNYDFSLCDIDNLYQLDTSNYTTEGLNVTGFTGGSLLDYCPEEALPKLIWGNIQTPLPHVYWPWLLSIQMYGDGGDFQNLDVPFTDSFPYETFYDRMWPLPTSVAFSDMNQDRTQMYSLEINTTIFKGQSNFCEMNSASASAMNISPPPSFQYFDMWFQFWDGNGCTDESACNYNPNSIVSNNDMCYYDTTGCGCYETARFNQLGEIIPSYAWHQCLEGYEYPSGYCVSTPEECSDVCWDGSTEQPCPDEPDIGYIGSISQYLLSRWWKEEGYYDEETYQSIPHKQDSRINQTLSQGFSYSSKYRYFSGDCDNPFGSWFHCYSNDGWLGGAMYPEQDGFMEDRFCTIQQACQNLYFGRDGYYCADNLCIGKFYARYRLDDCHGQLSITWDCYYDPNEECDYYDECGVCNGLGKIACELPDSVGSTVWKCLENLNECPPAIGGCTNEGAVNYNPDVDYEDGTCIFLSPPIVGYLLVQRGTVASTGTNKVLYSCYSDPIPLHIGTVFISDLNNNGFVDSEDFTDSNAIDACTIAFPNQCSESQCTGNILGELVDTGQAFAEAFCPSAPWYDNRLLLECINIQEQQPTTGTYGCSDFNACNYDGSEYDDGSCIYPLGLTTCFRDVDGNGYHELAEEINIDDCDINSCEDLGTEYATSYSYDGGGCNNNPAIMMATRGQTNIPPRIVNDSRYTNNRMVGDCNGDGWIDIHDINEVADMISTNRYDVCADTMNRNTIDKQDLINVMQHVSRHLPHDIDTMSIDKIKRWVERQDRKNNVYTMGLKVN